MRIVLLLACITTTLCTAMENNNERRSLKVDKQICKTGLSGLQKYMHNTYNIPIDKKRTSQTRKSIEKATSANKLSQLVDNEFEQFEKEIKKDEHDSLEAPDLHTIQEYKGRQINIWIAFDQYGQYVNKEQQSGCCTIL